MSRAEKKGEADLQKNRPVDTLLVVALGGLATAVWALVLGWLALRLF